MRHFKLYLVTLALGVVFSSCHLVEGEFDSGREGVAATLAADPGIVTEKIETRLGAGESYTLFVKVGQISDALANTDYIPTFFLPDGTENKDLVEVGEDGLYATVTEGGFVALINDGATVDKSFRVFAPVLGPDSSTELYLAADSPTLGAVLNDFSICVSAALSYLSQLNAVAKLDTNILFAYASAALEGFDGACNKDNTAFTDLLGALFPEIVAAITQGLGKGMLMGEFMKELDVGLASYLSPSLAGQGNLGELETLLARLEAAGIGGLDVCKRNPNLAGCQSAGCTALQGDEEQYAFAFGLTGASGYSEDPAIADPETTSSSSSSSTSSGSVEEPATDDSSSQTYTFDDSGAETTTSTGGAQTTTSDETSSTSSTSSTSASTAAKNKVMGTASGNCE